MMPKKHLALDSIRLKMEYFCSYQERCIYDVERKLEKYEMEDAEKKEIISHLQEHQFLDENRFVALFIKSKVNLKKDGVNKIKAALYAKKIPPKLIQEHLKDIESAIYSENMQKLIDRKKEELLKKNVPAQAKQKLIRYLMSKGYNYGEFRDIV
jgi:regulatory protein